MKILPGFFWETLPSLDFALAAHPYLPIFIREQPGLKKAGGKILPLSHVNEGDTMMWNEPKKDRTRRKVNPWNVKRQRKKCI